LEVFVANIETWPGAVQRMGFRTVCQSFVSEKPVWGNGLNDFVNGSFINSNEIFFSAVFKSRSALFVSAGKSAE